MSDEDYSAMRIIQLRCVVADLRKRLADAERELADTLAAAGRRPGDGSDQPELFSTAPPDLFADLQ